MIWGKTTNQKWAERQKANLRWFAWFPVRLSGGTWAWWVRLRRRPRLNWGTSWYDYSIITEKEVSDDQRQE